MLHLHNTRAGVVGVAVNACGGFQCILATDVVKIVQQNITFVHSSVFN